MILGIGKLIVAILVVAFVAVMFCLMLIGLFVIIAYPLCLLFPSLDKKNRWDKHAFWKMLIFLPFIAVLGFFGIELAKIFIPAILELIERFIILRYIAALATGFVASIPIGLIVTRKLRKEINELESKAKKAEIDYDMPKMHEYQDKCAILKKRCDRIIAICFGAIFLPLLMAAYFCV